MDTSWLRAFRDVARLGSITAAADHLGYTQSAVSRQVAALENDLGQALFDRLPRGVRLTEPGRCLLAHAEAVLGQLDEARRDLAALAELRSGRLRLGAFPTAVGVLVPQAMAAFHAAYPEITLSLDEGRTPRHVARLLAGTVDVAVLSASACAPLEDRDGLELRHLVDDPLLVALPAKHRFAGRTRLGIAELAHEAWITGAARVEDTLIGAHLGDRFRPRVCYVAAEWTAKQGLVAAGLGVTAVPSLIAKAMRPDIALVPLDTADTRPRAVYAATARDTAPSAAVAAFLPFLVEAASVLAAAAVVQRSANEPSSSDSRPPAVQPDPSMERR